MLHVVEDGTGTGINRGIHLGGNHSPVLDVDANRSVRFPCIRTYPPAVIRHSYAPRGSMIGNQLRFESGFPFVGVICIVFCAYLCS